MPSEEGEAPPADEPEVVTFRSGHSAEIVREEAFERLTLRARDGQAVIAIALDNDGATLEIRGEALEIHASRTLSLQAKHLSVEAESASFNVAGDLTERVAGDFERRVGGRSLSSAKAVAIEARPGGIRLDANDDVDVRGERIRLNSEDPPMPLSWEELRARHAAGDAPAALEAFHPRDDDGSDHA